MQHRSPLPADAMLAMAILSAYLPALRAAGIDPARTLRAQ